MNYIEKTYICLAAPLLLAILCMRREGRRSFSFLLAGMTACLLSAYVSAFAAGVAGADLTEASHAIAPVVEELMKSLPLLVEDTAFGPSVEATVLIRLEDQEAVTRKLAALTDAKAEWLALDTLHYPWPEEETQ